MLQKIDLKCIREKRWNLITRQIELLYLDYLKNPSNGAFLKLEIVKEPTKEETESGDFHC